MSKPNTMTRPPTADASPRHVGRRLALITFKLLVSFGLIALVSRSVDWRLLTQAVARLQASIVVLAIGLVVVQCALLSWRWYRIVGHLGGRLAPRDAMAWTLVGIFFNQALPSTVGGDALRIWMLHRRSPGAGLAVASVLVERVSGLVALALLVSACALSIEPAQPHPALGPLRWVGPLLLAAVAGALALGAGLARRLPARIGTLVRQLVDGFKAVSRHRGVLLETLGLGATASSCGLLAGWVLARGLGIDVSMPACFAFIGGAMLLTVLPISVGGWGLREVAVVSLFGMVAAPPEPVLALSLTWGLLPVLVSAPAALAWWLAERGTGEPEHPPTRPVDPS